MMRCYRQAIGLAALTGNPKARAWFAMRRGNLDRLQQATNALAKDEGWLWFHCASVGEFEQAQPVMKAMREQDRTLRFLLTFYSPSGWDYFAKKQPLWWESSDCVAAMPLDVSADVRKCLAALTPRHASKPSVRLFALAKYDVWPELIAQLKPHAPLVLFAGHVIAGRWPFRLGGSFHRNAWRNLKKVLVQSESSVIELERWGMEAVALGDPRFDRVVEAEKNVRVSSDQSLKEWVGNRICLVVGSAWETELRIAQAAWTYGKACIIVPHEWDCNWANRQKEEWAKRGAKAIVWSEFRPALVEDSKAIPEADVILLDAMGHLMDAYGAGHLSLVGGGFGKGVHNTLEPAAHGLAIWTGPKVGRFAEVKALQDRSALESMRDEHACAASINAAWEDPQRIQEMGLAARAYAVQNAGAGARIASELMGLIEL
jgi:3-deoxy-D-manno-octulosonic-acid transferase